MSTNEFNNEYYERYALNSLIRYYPNLKHLEKSESPDYQSKDLDIGIEVTRAINNGEFLFRMNSVFGKNIPASERKKMYEERFHKSIGEEIMVVNDCLVASETKNTISPSIHIDLIIKAIHKKNNLLNNGYTKFNNNWLYVFTDALGIHEYELDRIIKETSSINSISFDKIFIDNKNSISVICNGTYNQI